MVGGAKKKPLGEWQLFKELSNFEPKEEAVEKASLFLLVAQMSALGHVQCRSCSGFGHTKGDGSGKVKCPTNIRLSDIVKGQPVMARYLAKGYRELEDELEGVKLLAQKRLKQHDYVGIKEGADIIDNKSRRREAKAQQMQNITPSNTKAHTQHQQQVNTMLDLRNAGTLGNS